MPTAANLVIDWGNTNLKTGWFDGETLLETGRYPNPEVLLTALSNRAAGHVLVSSTSRPADEIRSRLVGLQHNFLGVG